MAVIELPDDQAAAQGLTLKGWLGKLAEEGEEPRKPLKTGRGMWTKYGHAPSAQEFDDNRREMFRNFAKDI
jgi:hypothetical protein